MVTGKNAGENEPSLVPGAGRRYCVETSCGQNEVGNTGPRGGRNCRRTPFRVLVST